MGNLTIIDRLRGRRGLSADWTRINPILRLGELGLETNTQKHKFGDGVNRWNSLGYCLSTNDSFEGGGSTPTTPSFIDGGTP